MDFITHGIHVLLKDNRAQSRIVYLSEKKKLNWRKHHLDLTLIFQKPFATVFQVIDNTIKQLSSEQADKFFYQMDQNLQVQQGKNNKNIIDNQKAQELQQEDIESLKKKVKGEQLIEIIKCNNSSFQQRSTYSKQKYLKRKKQKYIFMFVCHKITQQNLLTYYFQNQPKQVSYLRPDSFAIILYLLQLNKKSKVILLDKTRGLMSAAIAKRLQGHGQLNILDEQKRGVSKQPIFDELDVGKQLKRNIRSFSLQQLKDKKLYYSHLIMIGDISFKEFTEQLHDSLHVGGRIICFSTFLELVSQSFQFMQHQKKYVFVQLIDSFMRNYQIIKDRTHPKMSMDQFSGFICQGTKVF